MFEKLVTKCTSAAMAAGRFVVEKAKGVAAAGAAVGTVMVTKVAEAQVVLPEPVDIEAHVTAAITAMGAVVAVVAGGFFAFLIVRRGFSWGRRAL